jgi:hypothetical protein
MAKEGAGEDAGKGKCSIKPFANLTKGPVICEAFSIAEAVIDVGFLAAAV